MYDAANQAFDAMQSAIRKVEDHQPVLRILL